MSLNGSGTYSLPAGNPVVTGTTISSTTHNNTMTDIATALSTALYKDGQQTVTANIPMATYRITGLGDATAAQDAITAKQVQNASVQTLSSVAGTNTITGSATPTPSAYAAGQIFEFIPAADNTGATTLNISSLGAKNIFWSGAACVGGELKSSIPVRVKYDGTQFNIVGNGFNAPFLDSQPVVAGATDSTKKVRIEADGITTGTTRVWTAPDADLTVVGTATTQTLTNKTITDSTNTVAACTLATEQASTSGTAIDFTGIPSWVKKITIQFVAVSTSGTANPYIQIGDSGGIEDSGYLGASSNLSDSASVVAANYTAAFGIASASASRALHGTVTISLEDSANFTWVASGVIADSSAAATFTVAGSKSLSAALDRVRITTSNGSDTFDAGAINILYE